MTESRHRIIAKLEMPKNGIRKKGPMRKLTLISMLPFIPVQGMILSAQGRLVRTSAKVLVVSQPMWVQYANSGSFHIDVDARPMPTKTVEQVKEAFEEVGWTVHVLNE
jgi:hypothetical protein